MALDLQTIMAARLARVDVPRDEPRVSVIIDSTTDGLAECGIVIRAGVHQYDGIYKSDVEHLQKLVERDTAALQLATRDYEAHVAEVNEKHGRTDRPYRPALAASFRAMNRREMLPLRSVRVVEKSESRGGR